MIVRGENVPEHRRHSRTFSAMTEPRWLTDTEQRAWRAYLDSTRLLLQALDRELVEDSALSLTDYELLVRLSEAPARRLRMRELANTALATRSGVTRAVTRLEEAGWVHRPGQARRRRPGTRRRGARQHDRPAERKGSRERPIGRRAHAYAPAGRVRRLTCVRPPARAVHRTRGRASAARPTTANVFGTERRTERNRMVQPTSRSAFEVHVDELVGAAAVARSLADRLGVTAGEVNALADPLLSAVPGSVAAGSAGDATHRWGALLDDEAAQLRSLVQALHSAADDYRATDDAVARRQSRTTQR